MDRNEWSRRQLGSDNIGRPVGDPLEFARISASGPANAVAPSIAGVGYAGQTLTATAGTWESGTATGQWYADDVAISGETGSTYVVTAANNGAAFKYIETNGGITAESNVIHHALPTDVGVQAWYDMTDNVDGMSLVATSVASVLDKSGNGYHLSQESGSKQGEWDAAEGAIELERSKELGQISDISFDSILMVLKFNDGLDSTFDDHQAFVHRADAVYRISGFSGQSGLISNGTSPTTSYTNGASTDSAFSLPMPKRLERFDAPDFDAGGVLSILYSHTQSNRGWSGHGYQIVIPNLNETLANLQKLEGIVAHMEGITLDASHPYYSSPPTV